MKAAFFASCLVLGIGLSSVASAKPKASDAKKTAVPEHDSPADAAPEPEPEASEPKASEEPQAEPAKKSSAEAEPNPPAEKGGSEPADEKFGHGLQFGLRVGLTGGYRVIFRYDKSPFCRVPEPKLDKDQQKFCGAGAPLALDVALSFGVFDFVEPYAWGRFGLKGEAATNTNALTAFGVGARIYTMSDSKFKIFVEPAIGMEVEGGGNNLAWQFMDGTKPEYKTDFLFHLGVGPHYDFARAFGIYLNAGLTTGVLRYIHTELEITGGAQVRVP